MVHDGGPGVATWFPSGQFFPRSPHVGNMFAKLGLLPAAEDHRRVLAVLTYLRG